MSTSPPESPPEDVIFEILLLRLPAESLMRLKYVCKSWHCMITGPLFVSEHLKRSSRTTGSFHHLMKHYAGRNCHWVALLSPALEIQRKIETPLETGSCPFDVVGTCDGIVVLSRQDDVFLWNPGTRQSRTIPSCYVCSWRGIQEVRNGFGYCPRIGDYKLVRITIQRYGPLVRRWAGVFTLKEGSWRNVQHPDYHSCYYLESSGTLVSGTLNWVARGVRGEASTAILSFDLDKDEFKSICLPPKFELADGGRTKRKLAPLESSLLFMVYSSRVFDRYVEIWMTNPRATRPMWTRLLRIDADPLGVPEPLGLGSRGEIYIDFGRDHQVVVYEISTGSVLDKYKGSRMLSRDLYPYVESLVPLQG